MKRARSFFFFFLLVSIVTLGGGCATLPNVSEMIDEAPTDPGTASNRFGQRAIISQTEQSPHGTIAAIRRPDGHAATL